MPVGRWIREWIWEKAFGTRGETIIVLDDDCDGMLVGYGTWAHVEQFGSALETRHIEIAWFGVHSDYQGVPYEGEDVESPATPVSTHSVAEVVYAEVERAARANERSTEEMPITLTCHVDNDRALRFYEKIGFRLIPDPKLQIERDIYYRLVR